MPLSDDERELLLRVSHADEPVAMSDYFHDIHRPDFPDHAEESDPRREAWLDLQLALYGATVRLHDLGLVEIVHPANGERPDLVRVTEDGRSALG